MERGLQVTFRAARELFASPRKFGPRRRNPAYRLQDTERAEIPCPLRDSWKSSFRHEPSRTGARPRSTGRAGCPRRLAQQSTDYCSSRRIPPQRHTEVDIRWPDGTGYNWAMDVLRESNVMDNPYTPPSINADLLIAHDSRKETARRRLVAIVCGLALIAFSLLAYVMMSQAYRLSSESHRLPTRVPFAENLLARAAIGSLAVGATGIVGMLLNFTALLTRMPVLRAAPETARISSCAPAMNRLGRNGYVNWLE